MTIKQLVIREALPEDAPMILSFLEIVTAETSNLLLTPDDVLNISLCDEKKRLKKSLKSPNDLFLVAIKDKEVVGTANLQSFSRTRIQHRGTLGMAVLKKHWGKGIGHQLLNEIIRYARSNHLEMLELEVRADNLLAIQLYKKSGFKEYGLCKNYMQVDGQYYDGILMSLNLKN
ncbi:N-acetyltransferase family protein [Vagococcus elongatus]|uniref:GNAT family N-acetyltransferase n=1 Tax=Vagococcus elongatus TaxID=180344 RepID=A0A430B4G5_9ENTE|nr:GNAT family N-acetyltransferase [Vagococcus elongatus]RSU15141.1 GNAT family N-acetyltransferase [Vagococcus elongatus]